MEKEGFGEEFSIYSSFCFGGIRGEVIHIDVDLTIAMCRSNI